MPENTDILIRGGLVPDPETRRTHHRDLLIRDGIIAAIGEPGALGGDGIRVVDATNALILPGFVNAHTHSYGMLARHLAPGLPLEPWMMYSWAITGGRTPEEAYLSALLQGVEALLTGTTTVLDHLGGDVAFSAEAARAYQDLGIRAAVAPMISDLPLHLTVGLDESAWSAEHEAGIRMLEPLPAAELLERTRALHESWHGAGDGRISILLGPSAPQRCSPELLDGCAQLSRELGTRVHTHLRETRVQAAHPRAGVQTLDRHGLVDERLIGAHAIWTTPEELARLGESGASLVHNPQSNLQLGSGIAQLHRWRAHGVNPALGTDGANCGGSLDMLSSLRLATLLQRPMLADETRWETPWTTLDMATARGAQALGLDAVGRIAEGWAADLAVFDLSGTPFFADDDPLTALILSSTSSLARHVIVDGRVVVEDGVVEGVDLAELAERAREAREAIFSRNTTQIDHVAEAQREVLVSLVRSTPPPRPIAPFVSVGGEGTASGDADAAEGEHPAFDTSIWRVIGSPLVPATEEGPLSGLSLAVKDIFAVAGQRIGLGNPTWLAAAPVEARSAELVETLLAHGAEIRGITQMDEFAFGLAGTNAHYGSPPNPFAPGRVAGGSSSGSASAVALGQVDVGLGTDTGGSIRVPASYCGLFGLRTSHGSMPSRGLVPFAPTFDTAGWLTRDAETLDRVAQVLLPDSGAQLGRAVISRSLFELVDVEYRGPLLEAAERIAGELGLLIELQDDFCGGRLDDWLEAFGDVQPSEAWRSFGAWLSENSGVLGDEILERFRIGSTIPQERTALGERRLLDARGAIWDGLGTGSVLIHPAASTMAPLPTMTVAERDAMRAGTRRLMAIGSISGLPVVAVPSGLPIGLAIAGPRGSDRALTRLVRRLP
jgi:cytosine/adenosine deaminase-related metal-dependent hydrolase/Asp-tRNA(Asn)/Glu-tRNA(Gln) amidotransferase A subunit family amidase